MQKDFWKKEEIDLIKVSFKDETVLSEIRNVLFGFSDKQLDISEDQIKVLEKMFLPDLQEDAPLARQQDCYAMSSSLKTIGEIHPDVAIMHIEANDLCVDYLKRRFRVMLGVKDEGESLKDLRSPERLGKERLTGMLAYKALVNPYIDSKLNDLKILAEMKEETEAELVARLKKKSNK